MSATETQALEPVEETIEYQPQSVPGVDPYSLDLADIDMNIGLLFQAGEHHEYFKRLREEDPVHYCDKNPFTRRYF